MTAGWVSENLHREILRLTSFAQDDNVFGGDYLRGMGLGFFLRKSKFPTGHSNSKKAGTTFSVFSAFR